MDRLKTVSLYIFLGLLAYMPLHILLSTWVGTSFGVLEFAKVAKDIFLVIGFVLALVTTTRQHFATLIRNRLVQLILAYGLLTLALAIIKPTDQDAELLGLVYNTRFLVFFGYGLLLTAHYRAEWLLKRSVQVVLAVSVPVMLFGILQYTVLSETALGALGYSRENGVLPAFAIDDKPDLERIMASLRDPNSYGSYLIIIGALAGSFLAFTKKPELRKITMGILALTVINLLMTFSRSAWIGFALAAGVVLCSSPARVAVNRLVIKYFWVLIIGLLIVLGGVFVARDSYLVQNIVFHADESTSLEDPNELRLKFIEESVSDIAANPGGYGPGTAGLASIRNDDRTVLNENYYFQIAHEVGLLGLILFLTILALIALALIKSGVNIYSVALLASLAGLLFTNLLVHIWSNEAVAYTWWGLASLAYAKTYKKD